MPDKGNMPAYLLLLQIQFLILSFFSEFRLLSNVKNLPKSQESNIACVFHFIKSYPSRTFSHFKNVCWFVGKLNLIITQLKYVLVKKAWVRENGKTIITDWSVSQYFHYVFYCGEIQVNSITWISYPSIVIPHFLCFITF